MNHTLLVTAAVLLLVSACVCHTSDGGEVDVVAGRLERHWRWLKAQEKLSLDNLQLTQRNGSYHIAAAASIEVRATCTSDRRAVLSRSLTAAVQANARLFSIPMELMLSLDTVNASPLADLVQGLSAIDSLVRASNHASCAQLLVTRVLLLLLVAGAVPVVRQAPAAVVSVARLHRRAAVVRLARRVARRTVRAAARNHGLWYEWLACHLGAPVPS